MKTAKDVTEEDPEKDTKQAAIAPEKTPGGLQLAPAEWLPPTSTSNDKADEEELEEVGNYKEAADAAASIPNEMVVKKTSGTNSTQKRQENRRNRIAARAPTEDINPPTIPLGMERGEPYKCDQAEDEDECEEDETPGAVRVPGINATGVAEDDITIITAEETNEAISSSTSSLPNIVAHIVDEVPQAEIVLDEVKDDSNTNTQTRRRVLLRRTDIVIIMLAIIILGAVFGTIRSLRTSASPSIAPLNNSLCEEPLPIMLGGFATAVSLQDAGLQSVDFCDDELKQARFQPGLWYTVRGGRGM